MKLFAKFDNLKTIVAALRDAPSAFAIGLMLFVGVGLTVSQTLSCARKLESSASVQEVAPGTAPTKTTHTPAPVPTKVTTPWAKHAWVLEAMDVCLPEKALSLGRRVILAKQIDRIANEQLGNLPNAIEFLPTLICIESTYGTAKHFTSPAGAVGLTQVMPQYAKEFGEACGLPGLSGDDLRDSEVNLTVGACRFAYLVRFFKGNVALALAAYNAGRDSPAVRKLSAGGTSGISETDGYLAKAFALTSRQGAIRTKPAVQ